MGARAALRVHTWGLTGYSSRIAFLSQTLLFQYVPHNYVGKERLTNRNPMRELPGEPLKEQQQAAWV